MVVVLLGGVAGKTSCRRVVSNHALCLVTTAKPFEAPAAGRREFLCILLHDSDALHGKRVHLKLTPAGESILDGSWAERLDSALQTLPLDSARLDASLRGVLLALQRINGQHAFGICRQCAHFNVEENGGRCGLTGEPLAVEETARLCREWTAP